MSALKDIIRMYSEVATGTTMKQVGELADRELAALTDLLANIQECRKLGDHMLRKQINTSLELYEEQTKGQ